MMTMMIGIGLWLAVIAAVILGYLGLARLWRRHGRIVRATALPGLFLVIGAAALFVTDQGRDLGVALLDAGFLHRATFALALFYWAFATWHTGRFALDRIYGQLPGGWPADQERWIRWTPRVMGALVFVIAAASVVLAGLASGAWGKVGRLLTLVLAFALVYAFLVIERRAIGRWVSARLRVMGYFRPAERLEAAYTKPAVPSDDRHALAELATSTRVFLGGLLLVVALVLTAAFVDPWWLGDALGSVAIGFFAFGAYLVVVAGLVLLSRRFALPLVPLLLVIAVTTGLFRTYHSVPTCEGAEGCLMGEALLHAKPGVAEAARDWYRQASVGVAPGEPVPMILVATAGGGLRAAYWTAEVLARLHERLGADRLRRHLFAISGVSGGSVGATFFAALDRHLDAPDELPDRLRAALAEDFLAPTLAALAFVDLPSSLLPELGQTSRGAALEGAWERGLSVGGERLLEAPFMSLWASSGEGSEGRPGEAPWRPALLLNSTQQETGRRVILSNLAIDSDSFVDAWDLHALIGRDLKLSTAAHNSARFTYVSPSGSIANAEGVKRGHLIDGGYFENFGAITLMQAARKALETLDNDAAVSHAIVPILVQISSDPELLERDQARASRFARCGGEAGTLAFEETEGWLWWTRKGDDGGRLAFANELLAPIKGITATRVAHGTLASKELARMACLHGREAEGVPASDQLAAVSDAPAVEPAAGPARTAGEAGSRFAHFAMCHRGAREASDALADAAPPLGWVMSATTRGNIEAYLDHCRNPEAFDRIGAVFAPLD